MKMDLNKLTNDQLIAMVIALQSELKNTRKLTKIVDEFYGSVQERGYVESWSKAAKLCDTWYETFHNNNPAEE